MNPDLTRREMLARSGACLGAGAASTVARAGVAAEPATAADEEPFLYCLNMGTIMGYKLSIVEEIEVAAKAGYGGVEPWTRNLRRHIEFGHIFFGIRNR